MTMVDVWVLVLLLFFAPYFHVFSIHLLSSLPFLSLPCLPSSIIPFFYGLFHSLKIGLAAPMAFSFIVIHVLVI